MRDRHRWAAARVVWCASGAGMLVVAAACSGEDPSLGTTSASQRNAESFQWITVVNNNDTMPESGAMGEPDRLFNSYNPPAVNASGLVVFRARSRGGQGSGPPSRGIYTRDVSPPRPENNPIEIVADANADTPTPIPEPNNTDAFFIEFPSVPRVDAETELVSTRGQSQPVWTYTLPDGTETRVGTAGVYTRSGPDDELFTAASLLGAVPGFERFAVPGVTPTTRFDVFPGAPSPTATGDFGAITFKGNWTEGDVQKTGVFYRHLTSTGSEAAVQLIANSDTPIPNASDPVTFGSTAPPTASGDEMVFVGLDDEDAPTEGGIYLAPLTPSPTLTTLVGIGDPVPGVDGAAFTRFGEGLSFDGRFVSFWAAWGSDTRTLTLICPTEGNRDRIAFCNEQFPDGFDVEVPVHQGFFVHDTDTGDTSLVAQTGERFVDFLYWAFTGAPAEEDREPPRWRSSAFAAVSSRGANARLAFKARSADYADNAYVNAVDGIFLGGSQGNAPLTTVVDTTTDGQSLDPEAPAGSTVTEVGIERDGYRDRWLVINASIGTEEEGLAGIYATTAR